MKVGQWSLHTFVVMYMTDTKIPFREEISHHLHSFHNPQTIYMYSIHVPRDDSLETGHWA